MISKNKTTNCKKGEEYKEYNNVYKETRKIILEQIIENENKNENEIENENKKKQKLTKQKLSNEKKKEIIIQEKQNEN